MALKHLIRAAVSRKSSTASPSSSETTSPTTSGLTTPMTVSPTQSTTAFPALLPSVTGTSSKKSLTRSKTTSSSASSTSSSSSRFSLSRYRGKKEEDWVKYAPKDYKFYRPDPERVARLTAWEWGNGGRERGSVSSAFSCVSPHASRRNSVAEKPPGPC